MCPETPIVTMLSAHYPGAQEYCNYVDDDCDNTIDGTLA